MKRTHKFAALGDVQAAMNRARSQCAAAKALGVTESTLWRWIRAGKVSTPRHWRAGQPIGETGPIVAPAPDQSAEGWAAAIRASREFSPTDEKLIDVATDALRLAMDDKTAPTTRLAAMGRFQQLVRQLRLDSIVDAPSVPVGRPAAAVRGGSDPRGILEAIK